MYRKKNNNKGIVIDIVRTQLYNVISEFKSDTI